MEHFAASERTAAIEECDQPLVPTPSSMPSVIGFVPQKLVSDVLPAAAMIWSGEAGAAALTGALKAKAAVSTDAAAPSIIQGFPREA